MVCLSAVVVAFLTALGVPGVSQAAPLASSPSVLNWTKQHPPISPSARWDTAMAYDAATGTTVLFGGEKDRPGGTGLSGTWTWNGSAWAYHSLAIHPSARGNVAMAYAATGTVVLFGGESSNGRVLGDTWAWDGSTWTKQHPATSPPARLNASMAYDAATATVVLFGGHSGSPLRDTWAWGSG